MRVLPSIAELLREPYRPGFNDLVYVEARRSVFHHLPSGDAAVDNVDVFQALDGGVWRAALSAYITPIVGEVVFDPAAGSFNGTLSVSLSTSTDGATIHYTTDGSNPTTSSPAYSEALSITSTTTVKALAVKDGFTDSPIASATYTQQTVAEPVFSPNGGTVESGQELTLTSATSGATIRFTTNGSNPTPSSGTVYDPDNKPTLTASQTVKAIAYKTGYLSSSVVTRSFTVSDGFSDVYWGVSAEGTLDAAGIQALGGSKDAPIGGNYSFPASSPERYLFLAIRSTATMPRATDGFSSGGFPMTGDLAGSGEGYGETVNGWPYANVTMGEGTWRLFRTLYTQGLAVTITINT